MRNLANVLVETILVTSVKLALDSFNNKSSKISPQLSNYYLKKEAHAMAVRAIKENIKDALINSYSNKELNIAQLAKQYNVSTRTVGRVIEERGLATPVPRLRGEAYQVMQLLAEFELTIDDLKDILVNHKLKENQK